MKQNERGTDVRQLRLELLCIDECPHSAVAGELLAAGIIMVGATLTFAPSASAFEPEADPQNKFSCVGTEPVPGHSGYTGIETGVESSFTSSGGQAAAAWSGTVMFHGKLTAC